MPSNYNAQLERLYQCFHTCPDPHAREREDGWCVKEILGHLIDSAGNCHQRLLRYLPGETLDFPGYDQEVFVARAQYASFDYPTMLSLWYLYNKLMLHIITSISAVDKLSLIRVGEQPAITLLQMIEGYFKHMEKHHQQVKRIYAIEGISK